MDLYQAQEFFNKQYAGKNITYEFDDMCHRFYEIVITDSNPNVVHHVENNKVKVSVEGMEPFYVPIQPHRMNYTWAAIREMIMNKKDVFIHPDDIQELIKLRDESSPVYNDKMKTLMEYSGLSQEQIEAKIKG